ncbi:MAG: hypothetical protein WEA09_14430 [Gemmatimonadota bacterium]
MMTMTTRGGGRFSLGVVALTLMLAGGAVAPPPAAAMQGPMGTESEQPDEARAQELEAQAQELMTERTSWKDAARALRQAAQLREEGDPQAVSNLMTGARLAFYTGDDRGALSDLKQAGDRALAMGDVNTAAHAYLDAAWIGMQLSRPEVVTEYTHRADLLTRSPLLSADHRAAIQQRIEIPA